MLRKIGIGALIVPLILILASCAGSTSSPTEAPEPVQPSTPKPSGPIEAEWLEPQINGDTVSIPVSQIVDNWNTHFKLEAQVNGNNTKINFMAYLLDEEIHVRSNLCPPCRSVGFALENNILICDTCRTTFNAKTGDGINGACVDFPKAAVAYEIIDGQLVMSGTALIAAYQDTLERGWP